MDNNILNILIKSACESGQISDTDKEIIYKKAQQLGVAKEEVDKKIEQELANATSNNDLESGFIPMDQLDNDTQEQQTVNNQPLQQSKFTDLKPLSYQGAMSIVFQAKQYGKWIIIKRIKPEFKDNAKYKELFIREFENAYHLDHPNIVRLLDKGEDNEGLYYTMEFIDGRPLTELIKNQGLENKKLVPKIAKQILDRYW
jgi:serine/threonine protein kinase